MPAERRNRGTVIEGLREALSIEMEVDPRVFVLGEDLGIGGSFHLTLGLAERFGPKRVLDTPVSEAGFVGLAVGAAIGGLRPVVDFQYGDFLFPATDQIVQQAAKYEVMSGGQLKVPLVLHAPTGASGRGAQHATSVENFFHGVPGLVVGAPSTPSDAKGIMTTAIRHESPVLVLSHKHLYGSKGRTLADGAQGDLPGGVYEVPVGEAVVQRVGQDVTIASVLLMALRALEAADILADEGIDAEVIDLRWLSPLDTDAVVQSVRKTHRLLLVEEGSGLGGWTGSVAAAVADKALEDLDAPIRRLTGPDHPLPAASHLEQALIPGVDDIAAECFRLVGGS
jgi:acetoin:2,6-dichlorophenolindophenol oxidoreductase subunit beta